MELPEKLPDAAAGESSDGNGQEPICRCGATTFTFKNGKKRCAKGHVLVGNADSAITGYHGAAFRREHSAELDTMADRFARDAGYPSLQGAPLAFQIAAQSLARTSKVADLAYWKMLESGGPLSESGKPRRAYRIFKDTNSDLARDVKGAMSEVVAARPPGSESHYNVYSELSTDELIALNQSLGAELRELKRFQSAVRDDQSAAHLASLPAPSTPAPALSRDSRASASETGSDSEIAVPSTGLQLAGGQSGDPAWLRPSSESLSCPPSSSEATDPEPREEPEPNVWAYGHRVTESDVSTCMRDTGDEEAYRTGRIAKAEAYERTRRWLRAAREFPR